MLLYLPLEFISSHLAYECLIVALTSLFLVEHSVTSPASVALARTVFQLFRGVSDNQHPMAMRYCRLEVMACLRWLLAFSKCALVKVGGLQVCARSGRRSADVRS